LEKHRGDFIVAVREEVDLLINSAEIVATGPHMCYHLYKKDLSYAIFLDELAEALIQIG
jgi:tRNA(Glu) U13 pseudouridine synthase TruD